MQRSTRVRVGWCLAAAFFVAAAGVARAQSLTGTWQVTVSEVSNTCAEPLGPPELSEIEIVQAGDLIAATGPPDQTEISGVVSGANVAIAFEVFEGDGVAVYDPAENNLAITAGGTMLSGDLHWDFYEPTDCTGTHDWTVETEAVGTPGDLNGEWTLTATELTESCRPPDENPLPVPVTIQQEGDLLRLVSDVNLGQTHLTGRISGTTVSLGAAILQGGGVIVFEQSENALTIEPGYTRFSGTVPWRSFSAPTCSGVDSLVATLPEPDAALGALAAVASIAALRRRRRQGVASNSTRPALVTLRDASRISSDTRSPRAS